ncbi:hypothetical protein WJX73_009123 [Symbiochloris irregularis]|uniref:Uncharacterized protein n=1 Tax=Symbiochloris irregularis TaxID=706552 RepID=A0AAW1PSR8_9CHLO
MDLYMQGLEDDARLASESPSASRIPLSASGPNTPTLAANGPSSGVNADSGVSVQPQQAPGQRLQSLPTPQGTAALSLPTVQSAPVSADRLQSDPNEAAQEASKSSTAGTGTSSQASTIPQPYSTGHDEDPSKALEAARRQIAALQARLRAVMATNAALELQLADGQSDLGAQRKLQQELQERLAQMQAQLAEQAGWQVSMRAARNAESRAQAQLAEARRECEEKDFQLGGLTGRAQVERVLSLRSRVAELEEQLAKAKIQGSDLPAIAESKEQSAEAAAAQQQLAYLTLQVQELKQDLDARASAHRTSADQVAGLSGQLAASIREVQELQQDRDAQVTAQQASADQAAALSQQLSDSSREVNELTSKLQRQTTEVDVLSAKCSALQSEADATAKTALAELTELRSAAQSDREKAAAALSQVQGDLAKACAAADTLRQQASALQQQLGQQKDAAHVQHTQLSKDLSTSQSLASKHAAEAEKVAAALAALQATHDASSKDAESKHNASARSLSDAQQLHLLESLQRHHASIQVQHRSTLEEADQLRGQAELQAAELKTMSSNREEHFQGEIQRLNADYEEDRAESAKELTVQRTELSELRQQLDSSSTEQAAMGLTADLSAARSKATAQEQEVLALQAQLQQVAQARQAEAGSRAQANGEASAEAQQTISSLQEDLSHAREAQQVEESRRLSDSGELAKLQVQLRMMEESRENYHGSIASELLRLSHDNDMLRAKCRAYEEDVQRLVDTSSLGHSNPKQKLQYHLRWKQDLEAMRKETTTLLTERFQLEQCVRYLAVRCGLAVAVDLNVSGQQERTPLAKLQPASLTATYKFLPKRARLTHYKLDLDTQGTSPRASEAEAPASVVSDVSGESVGIMQPPAASPNAAAAPPAAFSSTSIAAPSPRRSLSRNSSEIGSVAGGSRAGSVAGDLPVPSPRSISGSSLRSTSLPKNTQRPSSYLDALLHFVALRGSGE